MHATCASTHSAYMVSSFYTHKERSSVTVVSASCMMSVLAVSRTAGVFLSTEGGHDRRDKLKQPYLPVNEAFLAKSVS